MKPLYIPVFAALFAMAPCAPAQTSRSSSVTTAPGAARAEQTTRTTATVTAVDPVHRKISMQRPDGRIIDVQAGADQVEAVYTEALAVKVAPAGASTGK